MGLAGLAVAFAITSACSPRAPDLSSAERDRIEGEIRSQVMAAYDLAAPDAPERLLSLYPDTGPIYSAGGGRFTAARDSLERGIREFWQSVGLNMRQPRWEWTAMHIDVLSPESAVMTASYRVPHRTPAGQAHVIAGVWTAVFARQDGRWVILHEHLSDLPPELAMADTTMRAAAGTGRGAQADTAR